MFHSKQIALLTLFFAGIFLVSKLVSLSHATTTPKANSPAQNINWQIVPTIGMNGLTTTYRAMVPGGWLVTNLFKGHRTGTGMAFIPDPDHSWATGSRGIEYSIPGPPAEDSRFRPRPSQPRLDAGARKLMDSKKVEDRTIKYPSIPPNKRLDSGAGELMDSKKAEDRTIRYPSIPPKK